MDHSRADLRRRAVNWRLLAVAALTGWHASLAAGWQEYQAQYHVYRNDKLIGHAEFRLEQRGERWIVRSEGSGTHGFARILRASDTESAEGRLVNGRFRPDRFSHHSRVAGIDDRWQALFDWDRGTVKLIQDRETVELNVGTGALDALSLKLEIQRRLREGNDELEFRMVDEDEIETRSFRVLDPEQLETSLGCLETIPVERVRANSTRYTRSWHSPALDFVTVRLEHGKFGGDHMEVRISALTLDGREVPAGPGCVAPETGG